MIGDVRKSTGRRGEEVAVEHLRAHGYSITERNYSCQFGEIDIVAQEGGFIVFVEVRSVSGTRFGAAVESVNYRKQRKLSLLAMQYLHQKQLLGRNFRFDVVGVHFFKGDTSVNLVKNAFEWREPRT